MPTWPIIDPHSADEIAACVGSAVTLIGRRTTRHAARWLWELADGSTAVSAWNSDGSMTVTTSRLTVAEQLAKVHWTTRADFNEGDDK